VLEVSDAALADLHAQLTRPAPRDSWQLAAFRSSDAARQLIQNLEQKHELEIVSSERLMAGVGRPISYHAGAKPYPLRVRFSAQWLPTGKLALRVKPQLGVPADSASAAKELDAGLLDGSSFLLEGFPDDPAGQNSAAELFPGHAWEHKHLVIFVSAFPIQQASSLALARTDRGR
jgi:hypothetical protein